MRFPSVAICTLTVLLAGGLSAQANDSISSEGSPQEPVLSEASGINITPSSQQSQLTSILSKKEAQLNAAQLETINSQKEFFSELSASTKHTPVGVEKQAETLAKIATAQAVKSQNSVTPIAISEVNQLASNHSVSENSSLLADRREGVVFTQAAALRLDENIAQSSTPKTSQLMADAKLGTDATCIAMANSGSYELAQGTLRRCPRPQPIPRVAVPEPVDEFAASPALSIYIPVGYGADRNTIFLSGSYQKEVRDVREDDEGSVGTGGIGIGLGNADKAVGVELSYAFETNDNPFGQGGFSGKLHRRFGQDLSAAIGWNGFLNIGRNDFEQSKYGVITKVFRTQDSLKKPFSRVAFTVGVGDGQYRSNGAVKAGDNNVNVFGNMAVRVVRPVSLIAEWTGQDLGLGLSIAPFKNIPFVITPAVRDLVGAGDAPRFVLGAGTAIRF